MESMSVDQTTRTWIENIIVVTLGLSSYPVAPPGASGKLWCCVHSSFLVRCAALASAGLARSSMTVHPRYSALHRGLRRRRKWWEMVHHTVARWLFDWLHIKIEVSRLESRFGTTRSTAPCCTLASLPFSDEATFTGSKNSASTR